jgi:DNA-binding SARP family transcriptional activator/nucleoid-associated protein YgaU
VTRRSSAVARGLISLIATAALIVCIPIGLAVLVGWPLPTSIPDGDSLTVAMNTGITDEFIVNALAVVTWLAWAQLTLALLVEAFAAVRGRPPRDLPFAPGLQAAAARLVAGIVMLVAPLQPARAVAAPAEPVVVVTPVEVADPVIDLRAPVATALIVPPRPAMASALGASTPGASGRTVTVERHDSYWAIAERELGDGLRWREVQALNVGRTMTDGHVIGVGDELLRAGWVLQVPADGPVGAEAPEPAISEAASLEVVAPDPASEVVVEPGDNLWDLSEERLADDLDREPTDSKTEPYWREVMTANHDRLVDPSNPGLIHPGQVLVLPPTGHADAPTVEAAEPAPAPVEPIPEAPPPPAEPEPTTPPTTAPSTTTSTSTPSTTAPSTTAPSTTATPTPSTAPAAVADPAAAGEEVTPAVAEETGDDPNAVPAWIALGGLTSVAMAVGAKRLIQKRRREFALDHDGADLPSPDPEDRPLHQAMVARADEELIGELQYALGELAVALAESGARCRPRLVRHSADSLEVLLDKATPDAPPGWLSEGTGVVWTLDHAINHGVDLDGPSRPAPLLVTIGQPDEGAHLYLDLEVDSVVSLAGDVEAARRLARSMLTELALTPLADGNRVITIGDLVEPEAAGLPHLTHKETWEDFARDLTAWVHATHNALGVNDWPNAFVGRGHDPDHEALMPMVVIATKPPPPELLDLLLDQRPSAVAVVVADVFEGALTTITCDKDTIHLDDVDLSFVPQQVDQTALEDMGRLICIPEPDPEGAEDHREGFDLDDAPPAADAPEEDEPAEPATPPEYEILVRLLGDIRVEGGGKKLHPKPTAVLAYLAMNRSVTSERLEEACWFGSNGTSHRKRLRETMSICREAIGPYHLPANEHGTYLIGDGVRTDVELFDWHVAQAVNQDPSDAAESYRTALELVTGRPFSYPNQARASFGWVDFEHHATTWEMRIAGVAKAYTEMCIDLNQPDAAVGELRRLLQAAPLNGGVVAALMRAHIESGDRSAADHVYQEHTAALEQAELGDPDDSVVQLRLDLLR